MELLSLRQVKQVNNLNAHQQKILKVLNDFSDISNYGNLDSMKETTCGVIFGHLLLLLSIYEYIDLREVSKVMLEYLESNKALSTLNEKDKKILNMEQLEKWSECTEEVRNKKSLVKVIMNFFNSPIIEQSPKIIPEKIIMHIIEKLIPDLYDCIQTVNNSVRSEMVVYRTVIKNTQVFFIIVNYFKFNSYLQRILSGKFHLALRYFRQFYNYELNKVLDVFFVDKKTISQNLVSCRDKIAVMFR